MINFNFKKPKKQDPKIVENLPNAFNPSFYRSMHLETARRLTSMTQGGYLSLKTEDYQDDEKFLDLTKQDQEIKRQRYM